MITATILGASVSVSDQLSEEQSRHSSAAVRSAGWGWLGLPGLKNLFFCKQVVAKLLTYTKAPNFFLLCDVYETQTAGV